MSIQACAVAHLHAYDVIASGAAEFSVDLNSVIIRYGVIIVIICCQVGCLLDREVGQHERLLLLAQHWFS